MSGGNIPLLGKKNYAPVRSISGSRAEEAK